VAAWIVLIGMSELAGRSIRTASAHGVRLAVSREEDTHHAASHSWHARSRRPTARSRCSGWCGRWAYAATLEVEFTDAGLPAEIASCRVVFVGVPEGHAISIKRGHAVIAPAVA